jgi:2-polyprenyl-3-methyl-5-hydroxy-6-metoxy-1,4-benzoquinol methylase
VKGHEANGENLTAGRDILEDVLQGYAAASAELIARFEEVSHAQLYAPVADLFPSSPSKIVDIGAGSGRDAAWLASKGHDVVAVEPVDELRWAGMALHKSQKIEWVNDRLPDLYDLRSGNIGFNCVLLSAVWQHLDTNQRCVAIRNLADLTTPGGMVIMSLRHGPGASSRRGHQVRPADAIDAALRVGFELIRERQAESAQAANRAMGVHWTWLVFGLQGI